MRNFYMAVSISENKDGAAEKGNYAYVVKFSENDNVKSVLDRISNLSHANMCHTKMEASQLVTYWNQCYKNNGTYLFDNPAF